MTTLEDALSSYKEIAPIFKDIGVIGGYLNDFVYGGISLHIRDDKWGVIPGNQSVKPVRYEDGSTADELSKVYNGITFYTIANKKAAPTEEADTEKSTTTTVPEIATACNGKDECYEKCVATDDFTCCVKCESLSECPTNCMEEM